MKLPTPKFIRFSIFFLFIFLLTGCGEAQLYHDLTESESNQILVVLQDRGIEAKKVKEEKSQQVSWTLTVQEKDLSKARKILDEHRLPRKKPPSPKEVCGGGGPLPTPEQEKCVKIIGLKSQIISSLERIPGVIEADIVLNIPEVSEFSPETQVGKRPTASAILMAKGTPEGLEVTEPKIQRFIANAVENLDPRDVSVIIKYAQLPEEAKAPKEVVPILTNGVEVAGLRLDPNSKKKFKIYAAVFLSLLVTVAGLLIFALFKLTKLRQQLKGLQAGNLNLLPAQGQAQGLVQASETDKGEGIQPPSVLP